MKILLKFLMLFILCLQLPADAITFNVLTLPADLFAVHENYFDFVEPSEIFADDIIKNLNSSKGKVVSPDLYAVRMKFSQNPQLKNSVDSALKKFQSSKYIDYKTFKFAATQFDAKSVILIRSYVTSCDNNLKRSIWDVLDFMSYFNVAHDFYLNTNIILLDTVNDLPMWQNTYVEKISNNEGYFSAKNYAVARTYFEKIKRYSKNIVSADASQNIILRFFPKVISPLEATPVKIEENGGTLRYNSNIPTVTGSSRGQGSEETDYGEMLLDY